MAGADRVTARQLWVVIESVHAVTYFAPQCRQALAELGLRGFWRGYFAARAAPLGVVGPEPVVAAFFNFHPAMVQRAIPSCWDVVDPETVTVERALAASEALAALVGADEWVEMMAALPALRTAAGRCRGQGRAMTGANVELWPKIEAQLHQRGLPSLQVAGAEVWQACTTLREHRGDGHVVAHEVRGLDGLDAHALAAGTSGVAPELLRENRGWSPEQWEGARARLAGRGLLHGDGTATEAGRVLRQGIEAMTDELAEAAFATLHDQEVGLLYRSLRAWARQIQASDCIPFPNPMGLPEL